jgi:D-serine deaminase-like pyridoxal phosphate-dependent protein
MPHSYAIQNTQDIITPALVVFRDIVWENIERMISVAGGPTRLRPHCKTHKTREVTRMLLERGVSLHKCATFAEAEMLADCGVKDIVLAYHLVGANIGRAVRFAERFPEVDFAVLADDGEAVAALSLAMSASGRSVGVLLDIDTGQHRTGIAAGREAAALYRRIADSPGLSDVQWQNVIALRVSLEASGVKVPRIVAGGTGSFPVYAEKNVPGLELSPGTCVFHDAGYIEKFPDLDFTPAALLLTRVISRPTRDRITLDLGYKAVASDPPAGSRLVFPDLPDARQVLQNEEHLVLETDRAAEFRPGDELLAVPYHICPSTAMHKELFVVANGRVVERWEVASRDRWLTV